MTAAVIALYALGLAAALGFIVLFRPREWARAEAVNAAGWILIVPVVFARSLVLIALHGWHVQPYQGWGDTAVSLGTLAFVDALLVLRFVTFARFRRREAVA